MFIGVIVCLVLDLLIKKNKKHAKVDRKVPRLIDNCKVLSKVAPWRLGRFSGSQGYFWCC